METFYETIILGKKMFEDKGIEVPDSEYNANQKEDSMKKDWKYYLGLSLFIYSFLPFSIVAVLPFMGMSFAQLGIFAVIFLASGEIALLCSAAVLGKEFLAAMKKRIMAMFKRTHEPKPISRSMHRFGITLLIASTLPYYAVLVYLLFFAHREAEINFMAWTMVAGEAACIAGLFILGGQFWDRLKHLFLWPGEEMENAKP